MNLPHPARDAPRCITTKAAAGRFGLRPLARHAGQVYGGGSRSA